jgi:hypothetical protein
LVLIHFLIISLKQRTVPVALAHDQPEFGPRREDAAAVHRQLELVEGYVTVVVGVEEGERFPVF